MSEHRPDAGPVFIDLARNRQQWPLGIKLRRVLWSYLLQPLVRWLPKPLSPLRVSALRLMGADIGSHCTILPGVRVLMPWNLKLGDWAALGEGVNVYNFAPVTLGPHSVVSQFGYLCTGSHDYTRTDMPLTFAPITLGSQVWVAAGVFVAPGIAIADGVVVGAMSVVTRNLDQAWTIYAGNPCRRIKARPLPAAAADDQEGKPA
ncbi:putative glycose-acyl transferase [Rubrivivax sp. A210]|uniref:putative colanic acid biosynthesis acetyltransferase n=1 Tax=Rubrivivax sp. A210 TaxID=2772301 RepID=UPI00191A52D6|nr:putative colanic acid biosynthesis acetyltransferase [Rubrivivax sp. A210]CAD5369174.1 putative glycose-acyl transferase [Rubrivivax sp. A210]